MQAGSKSVAARRWQIHTFWREQYTPLYGIIMRAATLTQTAKPLALVELPKPSFNDDELLIRVKACGVCRTDLHIKDGELPAPHFPVVLGHEIVGIVEDLGKNCHGFHKGERVGVPWLAASCGICEFCQQGKENLCNNPRFTGYDRNGGFAEYTVCRHDIAIPLPSTLSDEQIAPLLCAGLIGYRAYRKAAPEHTLGIYGFGAAAHIVTQLALHEDKQVFAFTRKNDSKGQEFAKSLGVSWAGDSDQLPPISLDAAIIFAPVGELVPLALKALKKGGRCICGGIHMSDIPSFPYRDLWGEKSIHSVANLTRQDAREFFTLIASMPIRTTVTLYPLDQVNQALTDLKEGNFHGAAVISLNR